MYHCLSQHRSHGPIFVIYFRFAGLYTMDVIASTAFGLKIDSQKDKNNQFVKMAKKIFEVSFTNPFLLIASRYTYTFDVKTKNV